ncbi:MAG: winged helix-turn-helix transcriptional regulator [Candidatus Saganbacteria bacterium]|nr:winged helix-turn-helix transcriptional regulator [Candidatus Saganbacteria bacterium]
MDDNELKAISEIQRNSRASQRELSKILNLSLGMTNIILHRLMEKGYMKIKQLDGRKVQYFLTPKGLSEKLRRSRQYLQDTILNFEKIKELMKMAIVEKKEQGYSDFYIFGDWYLDHIIELGLKEIGDRSISCKRVDDLSGLKGKHAVLFCAGDVPAVLTGSGVIVVDIAKILS